MFALASMSTHGYYFKKNNENLKLSANEKGKGLYFFHYLITFLDLDQNERFLNSLEE